MGSVAAVPEYLDRFEFGYIFPKTEAGQALCGQFSDFIEKLKADGTLEALEQKWISETEKKDMPDISSLSPVNGTLTMATEALYEPFTYIQDGKIVGYDIEIAVRFCQEYGYGLEIVDMNFSGILPAVTSEKCDFGGAGITITPERAESVLFSVPNYSGGTVLAVLKGLESEEELYELGMDEYLGGDGIAVIEWAERCPEAVPENVLRIRLEVTGGESRRITIDD